MVGIQVAYFHVGRKENREADGLAKGIISGSLPGGQGQSQGVVVGESFHYNVY